MFVRNTLPLMLILALGSPAFAQVNLTEPVKPGDSSALRDRTECHRQS